MCDDLYLTRGILSKTAFIGRGTNRFKLSGDMCPKLMCLMLCLLHYGKTVDVSMLSQLEITRACFMEYGQSLKQVADAKSVQACAVICTDNYLCSSFIFDQGSLSCSTNSHDVPGDLSSSCQSTVIYGQMVQVSEIVLW